MVNGIGDVGGTITGIVGLGVTLGALGLALEFVDRSFDRATPRNGKRQKRQPLFDLGFNEPRRKTKGRRSSNSIFDVPKGGDFF